MHIFHNLQKTLLIKNLKILEASYQIKRVQEPDNCEKQVKIQRLFVHYFFIEVSDVDIE